MTDAPIRVLPALDDDNRFFWTSGADGRLRFARCQACGFWLHPPTPYCPSCDGREVAPKGAPELETLPGIGPSTAQKIVDYRDEVGLFTQIEDIMNVSGIGEGKFDKIKDQISVEDG